MRRFIFPLLFVLVFAGFFSFQKIGAKPLPYSCRIKFEPFLCNLRDDGLNSISMLLNYYSKSVVIGEVDEIITPEVVRVILSKNGLDSEVVYGNIRDLKRFISDGRPVIVLMRFGDFCWKYCIVFGYDEENIYLGNCNGLPKTLSLRDFENCWGFSHDYFGRKCLDCKGPSDKFTMIVPVWN